MKRCINFNSWEVRTFFESYIAVFMRKAISTMLKKLNWFLKSLYRVYNYKLFVNVLWFSIYRVNTKLPTILLKTVFYLIYAILLYRCVLFIAKLCIKNVILIFWRILFFSTNRGILVDFENLFGNSPFFRERERCHAKVALFFYGSDPKSPITT